MRLKNFIATTALATLPLIVAARPASPELMRHVNPDGTTVEFRLHGNEHFSYITDSEGVSILEYDKAGRLVPAVRNGVALRAIESDVNLLRAEMPEITMPTARPVSRMAQLETSGENRGRTTFPSVGEVRSCVILMEFPDRPFSTTDDPQKLFERYCNEEGFSDFNALGSARDYYKSVSNGKFIPTFDVYGPVRLSHDAAWYTTIADDDPVLEGLSSSQLRVLNNAKQPRFGCAIQEAMEALAPTIDFSVYDYDQNGEIDNIFFFYSGHGQADSGDKTAVWPHQSDYRGFCPGYTLGDIFKCRPQIYNGVQLTCYATSCELNSSYQIPDDKKPWLDGIGAFCHEFAHVLGLPDMYDTQNSGCKTPGKYSVMDQGSYNMLSTCPPGFSGYEQWVCKWIEYTDATDGEAYTLQPLVHEDRNCVRMRIRQPGGAGSYYPEYYVMESRGEDGWDQSLPEHGLLIWRINYNNSVWQDNAVNSSSSPRVEVVGPDEKRKKFAWPNDDDEYTYITPDMRVLVPTSLRNPLNVYLTGISYDWETGVSTVEYNKHLPYETAPVLQENPKVNHEKREIYLQWEQIPGVQYALTVRRTDSTGRQYTVDGLDEEIMDENYRTVRNITRNQWSQEFEAYVRVFDGIPGKVISNVIKFVPEQMAEGDPNGVEGVGIDIPVIYGGKGCVVAPEGSKVYNMSGVECGMNNLPAGIYIVVANGATAKVSVR